MAIEPIKGFYVHDEATNTDGVASVDYNHLASRPLQPFSTSNSETAGYLNASGQISEQSPTNLEVTTDYIPVLPGDTFLVSLNYTRQRTGWLAVAYYDDNKTYISPRITIVDSTNIQSYSGNVTVPVSVGNIVVRTPKYIRFSYRSYGEARLQIESSLSFADMVDRSREYSTKNLFSYSLSERGYINFVGIVVLGANNERTSDYIPVTAGNTYHIKAWQNTYDSAQYMWIGFCFYDADKNTIGNRLEIEDFDYACYVAPEGAEYMRVSARFYDNVFLMVNEGSSPAAIYKPNGYDAYISNASVLDALTPISWMVGENVKGVNHRGFNTAPENTLPAYKLSKKQGFKYVETDVLMTSDRVPVLLHDDTINRTARNADGTEISSTISIGSITYEQALTYDFGIYKGEQYAGTKIPTFAQFIKLCRNLGLHPYIELKATGGYTEAEIQWLVDIVELNGMRGKVSWISFSSTFLTYVKNCDSSARLGFVVGTITSANIDTAISLRTTENEVFLDGSALPSELVDDCISAGIPVEVWTVNSASTIEGLDPYISGVTSDNLIAAKVLYDANKD